MKSTRRGFLGRCATIASAVVVAPAVTAEAAPECLDCARLWSRPAVLPDAFRSVQMNPDALRSAVHERAVRQSVSHEEAGMAMAWESFPSLSVEPPALSLEPMVVTRDGVDMGSTRAITVSTGDIGYLNLSNGVKIPFWA
jgi:hypothetical protein